MYVYIQLFNLVIDIIANDYPRNLTCLEMFLCYKSKAFVLETPLKCYKLTRISMACLNESFIGEKKPAVQQT